MSGMKQCNAQGSTNQPDAWRQYPVFSPPQLSFPSNILYFTFLVTVLVTTYILRFLWQPIFPVCRFSIKCGIQDTATQLSLIEEPSRECKRVSYDNLKLSMQTNAVIVKQIPPLFLMFCPHSIALLRFIQGVSLTVPPGFQYQMKNKLKPTRAPFSKKKSSSLAEQFFFFILVLKIMMNS